MLVAIDTETTMIKDRAYVQTRSGSRVRTEPFEVPQLACVSATLRGRDGSLDTYLYDPQRGVENVVGMLTRHDTLVMHNAMFDIQVLIEAGVPKELFMAALDEGRIHDTMYLHLLLGLANGRYEIPKWVRGTWQTEEFRVPHLKGLALEYLGLDLSKDNEIRCNFGDYIGRFEELPEEFVFYAKKDAEVTMKVFLAIRRKLNEDALGWLSEAIQLRCAWVFAQMDKRGVRIDQELAKKLEVEFSKYLEQPRADMVQAGLGSWEAEPGTAKKSTIVCGAINDPSRYRPGQPSGVWVLEDDTVVKVRRFKNTVHEWVGQPKFKLNTRAIQARLEPISEGLHKKAPRRADGGLKLEYDFWHEHAPADDAPLQTWLQHEKIKKVLTAYLFVYARCKHVFARWNVMGAKSGRTSASSTSVQNVPKRRLGIRSLFQPPTPGKVFVISDFSAQELFTLAQSMKDMGIEGPLLTACQQFNRGKGPDLHRFGASLVLEKPMDQVTKDERQGQKALHFGVPGGLGAPKLSEYAFKTYGVRWSIPETKRRLELFFRAFPDFKEYLSRFNTSRHAALMAVTGRGESWWRNELMIEGWNTIREMLRYPDPDIQEIAEKADRQQIAKIRTGRRRGYCRYTEAANFGFQGLAADVSKEAMWNCECRGLEVVLFCHDEIVVECDPAQAETVKNQLEACMYDAFEKICPDVGPYAGVESEIAERWGKTTDISGEVLNV